MPGSTPLKKVGHTNAFSVAESRWKKVEFSI